LNQKKKRKGKKEGEVAMFSQCGLAWPGRSFVTPPGKKKKKEKGKKEK